jgi:hypothetical protein
MNSERRRNFVPAEKSGVVRRAGGESGAGIKRPPIRI